MGAGEWRVLEHSAISRNFAQFRKRGGNVAMFWRKCGDVLAEMWRCSGGNKEGLNGEVHHR